MKERLIYQCKFYYYNIQVTQSMIGKDKRKRGERKKRERKTKRKKEKRKKKKKVKKVKK